MNKNIIPLPNGDFEVEGYDELPKPQKQRNNMPRNRNPLPPPPPKREKTMKEKKKIHPVKSRSYTLRTEEGYWLGQVVLTEDGLFASVTDYGNLSFAWRSFGSGDFRKFIQGLGVEYFGGKMQEGLSYIAYTDETRQSCMRFAKRILPPLQEILKEELKNNVPF